METEKWYQDFAVREIKKDISTAGRKLDKGDWSRKYENERKSEEREFQRLDLKDRNKNNNVRKDSEATARWWAIDCRLRIREESLTNRKGFC